MQQVVITLNVLLISRPKNAHNDHALIVVFGIIRLALKVACMFAGGWAEEKSTRLNIHMWYSHLEI